MESKMEVNRVRFHIGMSENCSEINQKILSKQKKIKRIDLLRKLDKKHFCGYLDDCIKTGRVNVLLSSDKELSFGIVEGKKSIMIPNEQIVVNRNYLEQALKLICIIISILACEDLNINDSNRIATALIARVI